MSAQPDVGPREEGGSQTGSLGARGSEQITAEEMITTLDLSPHREGGFFRETYRSEVKVSTVNGDRSASTSIAYLLTAAEPSRFHRLRSDELWFYHSGGLAELVLLRPRSQASSTKRGTAAYLPEQQVIGPSSPYALVPAGWWVAVRVILGEQADWGAGRAPERRWTADRRAANECDWTLVSCMVTPGFEYEDFEIADPASLIKEYPLAKDVIRALT